MKITTWNVNGIRAIIKKNFESSIRYIQPDVLCLQETKAQTDVVQTTLASFQSDFQIYINSAQKKGYSGTAVLSKTQPINCIYGMGLPQHDHEGRIITLEYQDFFLVTVYSPNAGQGLKRLGYKQDWNFDFQRFVVNLKQQKPVVICGDLNVAHQDIDLKNPRSNYNKTAGYTQVEIDGMNDLLASGFVDVFRRFYPDEIAYTYWSYRFNARAQNAGWRIDYFIVSNDIIDKIEDIEIHADILGSDHCPVSLTLNL